MMGCQDYVIKRLWLLSRSFSLLLSDLYSGGIKLSCYDKVLWGGLCDRGPRPAKNHMNELGSRIPGSASPGSSTPS